MVPSFEAFQKIMSAMQDAGLKVKILKMGKFEPKEGVLTEKQERIFWLALKGGFFDYPRKIDTAELAAKLGIRQNMVSDYERGRRTYSDVMAKRLSKTLKVKEEYLKYGSEQDSGSVTGK